LLANSVASTHHAPRKTAPLLLQLAGGHILEPTRGQCAL
jgi:hypothetical protein